MSNILGDLKSVEYNILKKDWETENNTNEFGGMIRFDFQIYETKGTAVRRHCTDWYEIWALTDHEIYYIKIELDLGNFQLDRSRKRKKVFG